MCAGISRLEEEESIYQESMKSRIVEDLQVFTDGERGSWSDVGHSRREAWKLGKFDFWKRG